MAVPDQRISGAPLHFVTRCTASGTHDSVRRVPSLSRHALAGPIPVFSCFSADSDSSIPGLTISSTHTHTHTPPRSRGACLRPGFASLLHSPRIEGWAERRSAQRHAPTCSPMQRSSPKIVAEPRISKILSTVVQPRALTRNRTKCRLTCGSGRMLTVRSGSRAKVEKKAVRLGGVIGDHRVFAFWSSFQIVTRPYGRP